LRVLDAGIKRVAPVAMPVKQTAVEEALPVVAEEKEQLVLSSHRLGVVFNFNKKTYPYFTIDVVQGEGNDDGDGFTGKVEKIDLSKYIDTTKYSERDKQSLSLLRKLQEQEINKYISRNSPFSGIWENIIHQEDEDLPDETKNLMNEYLLPKLKKTFSEPSLLALSCPRERPLKQIILRK
jgi:non-specific serine/threonine protein kinase